MNILVCCLTYGNRPYDILHANLEKAGMPFQVMFVAKEGIANAQNEAIYLADKFDVIAYLSNDIIEPDNWLVKKVQAMQSYPDAGIIATCIERMPTHIQNEMVISNWLMSSKMIEKVGQFNESFFPYGPIDLDYCERAWLAGFNTYYMVGEQAHHVCGNSTGDEYGWSKEKLVAGYWELYNNNIRDYKNGTKNFKI